MGHRLAQQRVVAVEDYFPKLRASAYFELRAQNALNAAEAFEMRGRYLGYYHGLGREIFHHLGYLAEVVRAKLEDERLRLLRHREHGQRAADDCVEAAHGAVDFILLCESRGGQLARRRFADAAGYRNSLRRNAAQILRGGEGQRLLRAVLHYDERDAGEVFGADSRAFKPFALREDDTRALISRLLYVEMSVCLRPAYGGEAVTPAHLAAVASPRARDLRLRAV